MNTPSGKKILILIFSLASFLVPFTVSSLNVALPAIGVSFGLDPTTTGLILLAQPLIQMIVSPVAGNLSNSVELRLISTAGMICTAAGLFILVVSVADSPLPVVILGLAVLGLGYGLFSSPNTNAIMSSVDIRHLGVASGMVSTMRSVG